MYPVYFLEEKLVFRNTKQTFNSNGRAADNWHCWNVGPIVLVKTGLYGTHITANKSNSDSGVLQAEGFCMYCKTSSRKLNNLRISLTLQKKL